MTDKHDTLVHWLAFDLETTKSRRISPLEQLAREVKRKFRAMKDVMRRTSPITSKVLQ